MPSAFYDLTLSLPEEVERNLSFFSASCAVRYLTCPPCLLVRRRQTGIGYLAQSRVASHTPRHLSPRDRNLARATLRPLWTRFVSCRPDLSNLPQSSCRTNRRDPASSHRCPAPPRSSTCRWSAMHEYHALDSRFAPRLCFSSVVRAGSARRYFNTTCLVFAKRHSNDIRNHRS